LFSQNENDWVLRKDKNNIQVYTRKPSNSDFLEFRAVTKVKTSFTSCQTLITDFNNYNNWLNDCKIAKVLQNNNTAEYVIYLEFHAPWPFSNRDIVLELKKNVIEKSNSIRYLIESKSAYIPLKSGIVRIPKMDGFWQLKQLDNGYVEIQYQLIFEPGGNIPAWMANYSSVDSPFKTFEKIREIFP
jgi:ribosome-associated toxin RatA of RatAB toxin-antitoxin module